MPRRKKGRRKNRKESKEIAEQPEFNNENEKEKKIESEDLKIEEKKEIIKSEIDVIKENDVNTNFEKKEENNIKEDKNNIQEENNVKIEKDLNVEINLKNENDLNDNKNIKDKNDTIKNENNLEEESNLKDIKNMNLNNENIVKNEINKEDNNSINENNIKDENVLKEENNINDKNNIVKNEINENDMNNEKKNLSKIVNKDYEEFIKNNEELYQYISKEFCPIIVQSPSFNKNEEIKLRSKSLLKIISLSSLENELKIYLTKQILTENIQFETSSSKKITYNTNIQDYIKNKEKLNISFQKNESDNINDILISKDVFINIFSKLGKDYYEEIFNYMKFTVTEISYEYSPLKKMYILKGVRRLRKLMDRNEVFYLNQNGNNDDNNKIPLSNYSIQEIFNLYNGGKDSKYLLIDYKIKNEEDNKSENENKKNNFDKLIDISNIKKMYKKYNKETQRDPFKFIKQEKLKNYNPINIKDLNNYLVEAEEKLFNIYDQINNKKKEITKLVEDSNNIFIQVIDSSKNTKFINNQYLNLMKGEDDKFNKNIYSLDFYDYNNEKITVMEKNLENLSEEEKTFVEIKIDDNNYLVNKNKLLKIYDSWRILYQEDTIDAINTKKLSNNFEIEKIDIILLNTNIVVQDIIKEIKKHESNEDFEDNNNEDINSKKNENHKSNIIIIEEEEMNENEDDKILGNNKIIENENKKNKEMIEYINSLPPKKSYNIKYKVKIERIPKKKHN